MPAYFGEQALLVGVVLIIAGAMKVAGQVTLTVAERSAFALLLQPTTRLVAAWRAIGLSELGVGLLVLALPTQQWPRVVAAVLLAAACGYTVWSRFAAPDRPCGCFGAASTAPPSRRSIARTATLLGIAILAAAANIPWFAGLERPSGWLLIAVEGLVLAYLSPETYRLQSRLHAVRGAIDCATIEVPLETSLGRLRASEAWKILHNHIVDQTLREYWHDDCIRFLNFSAQYGDRSATAVFAVSLETGNSEVKGMIFNEDEQQVLLSVS